MPKAAYEVFLRAMGFNADGTGAGSANKTESGKKRKAADTAPAQKSNLMKFGFTKQAKVDT